MKKILVILIIGIIICSSKCSCGKEEQSVLSVHLESFEYYPKKDTFNIGDTIYFKLTIPKEIEVDDRDDTGEYKDFYGVCSIIDTSKQGSGYVNFYMHIEQRLFSRYGKMYDIKGFSNRGRYGQYIFKEEGENYVYECGVIINKLEVIKILDRDIHIYIYGINNTCNKNIYFLDPRYKEYKKIYVKDTAKVVSKP